MLLLNEEALRRAAEVIGRNVRARRIARGMSQEELGSLAGVSQPKISNLENAQENPTLAMLTRVAAALDLEVAALLKPRKD